AFTCAEPVSNRTWSVAIVATSPRLSTVNVTELARPAAWRACWMFVATAARSPWLAWRVVPPAAPLARVAAVAVTVPRAGVPPAPSAVPPDDPTVTDPGWAWPTPVPTPTMLGPPFRIPLLAAAGLPNAPRPFRNSLNFFESE